MEDLVQRIRSKNAQLSAWEKYHPDSPLLDKVQPLAGGEPKRKIDIIGQNSPEENERLLDMENKRVKRVRTYRFDVGAK